MDVALSEAHARSDTEERTHVRDEVREDVRLDQRNRHTCFSYGEFDPGSERTLAAGLTHASRARE